MPADTFGQTISRNWLLSIHLIIPFLFLVWVIDTTLLEKSLLPYMGMETLLLPLYLLIFELPHIIASLLTFADTAYLNFYRRHLLIGLPCVLFVVGVSFYLNPTLTFFVYIAATMYHVIRQQTGIASMFAKIKGFWFQLWSFSMIFTTTIMLFLVAIPNLFSWQEIRWYSIAVFFLLIINLLSGAIYFWQSKTTFGRLYIVATSLMLFFAYFFVRAEYIFFAIFSIRFVHDITAFTFYVVHDSNRNAATIKNSFYALVNQFKLPFIIVVPAASIIIALLLRLGINKTALAMAVVILSGFAHYYVEAIMWKRDSLHRQQIKFSGESG